MIACTAHCSIQRIVLLRREICGVDQKVYAKGAANGSVGQQHCARVLAQRAAARRYNHEEQWKVVEADHKRFIEREQALLASQSADGQESKVCAALAR